MLDSRVTVRRIYYTADEDASQEEIEDDETLPILFRDIVDPSSVGPFVAYLVAEIELSFITHLIEENCQSARDPINIHFTFCATPTGEYAAFLSSYTF